MYLQNLPEPVELSRSISDDLRDRAADGVQDAAYVLRDGSPTWVTVSVEGVIANIQQSIVEADPQRPGWFRVNPYLAERN